MKITPDDPRLTAFALGELSAAETATVREALENDAALKSELELTQGLASLLSGTLSGEGDLELGDERREEIHQSGKRPDAKVLVMDHQRRARWQSFAVVAGVAAVVTFGFYLLSETSVESVTSGQEVVDIDQGERQVQEGATPAADGSTSDKVVISHPQEAFREATPVSDELITVTERTAVKVPVVGRVDLARFQRSLEQGGVSAVRVEEFVNAPNYEVKPEVELESVGISAELGVCSWNEEAQLLMVVFRDLKTDGVSPQIDGRLLLDSPRVASIKLVASGLVRGKSKELQSLTDGRSSIVLYEVILNEGEGRCLLYTSPSPRDQRGSRMPSSA